MKVISAFAGLGGAELALKRAGIQSDTIPDKYTKYGKFADGSIKEISNKQRYKMLGNGFVIDVIVDGILKNLKDILDGKEVYKINYGNIESYL